MFWHLEDTQGCQCHFCTCLADVQQALYVAWGTAVQYYFTSHYAHTATVACALTAFLFFTVPKSGASVHVQVFDGDIAYLHQAAIIAKSHDANLNNWAKEYYLASAADRYVGVIHLEPGLSVLIMAITHTLIMPIILAVMQH